MAYRSSSSTTGSGSPYTVPVPAGVATNDITIGLLSNDGTGNNTAPTGWTALSSTSLTFDGEFFNDAWHRATGADSGNYTFNGGSGNPSWVTAAGAWSGRDTGNPPVASSVNKADSSHTGTFNISANGVTALAGDDLVWVAFLDLSTANRTPTWTAPTGYTLRQSPLSAWDSMAIATQDNVSAGATGTITGSVTLSAGAAAWAAYLIRIPAVPVAVLPVALPPYLTVPLMRAAIL